MRPTLPSSPPMSRPSYNCCARRMVRRALKPSLRAASCCSVEVVNGGAGLRRRCLRSMAMTRSWPGPSAGTRARRSVARRRLYGPLDLARLRLVGEAELLHLLAAVFDELEREGSGAVCEPSPSILQYSCGMNARISASRSQIMRSAGLCTRPAESPWRTFFHSSGERLKPTR